MSFINQSLEKVKGYYFNAKLGKINIISNLAGMFGNDETDNISFISAYDDSVTPEETKAIDKAHGITSFSMDAMKSARIILSDNSDATTVVHEMFHVALKYNQQARSELRKSVRKQIKQRKRRSQRKKRE